MIVGGGESLKAQLLEQCAGENAGFERVCGDLGRHEKAQQHLSALVKRTAYLFADAHAGKSVGAKLYKVFFCRRYIRR